MNKIIICLLPLFLMLACSGNMVNNNSKIPKSQDSVDKEELAQNLYIDGAVLELKGEYIEALDKYLMAYRIMPDAGIAHTIAKNYYKLNKLATALPFAKDAVKKDSANVDYLSLLAVIYNESHLDDSSAVIYNKMIENDSTNVNALFGLAQIIENKRPNESIKLYKKIISIIGPEWNVLVKLIEVNERLGNVPETIKTIEELIQLNPSQLQLQKLLIETYLKTGDVEKAYNKANEALISFPDDLNLIEMKANAAGRKGLIKESLNEYLKLFDKPEMTIEWKIRIGMLYLSESEKDTINLEAARTIFERIDKDTLDWQINSFLGEIAIRQKRDSVAIDYLKKATELAEWNNQVWIRLGGILFDARKYKEAVQFMEKASTKFPNDFAINLIYGLCLSQLNEHLKAKDFLKRALNIVPDDVNALGAMGFTLNQLKEEEEALKYLDKAIKLDAKNLQVISITALIHETRKNYTVSDSLYTVALAIDSTDALTLNNYAYSLADRGIKLQEALAMSKKAVEADPKNSSYLDTIGWIYFKMGEYKKAKENIEASLKIENNSATVIDHLGDVLYKLGEKKKALENWKKAFEKDNTLTSVKEKIEKGGL